MKNFELSQTSNVKREILKPERSFTFHFSHLTNNYFNLTLVPLSFIFFIVLASSCSLQQQKYSPSRKFSPQQLQEDYQTFRNILEESHPSLYWYTPKDSIDHYFEWAKYKLNDSLTESGFRNVLSYVVSKFRCGHTSVRASKAASSNSNSGRNRVFPLNIKAWPAANSGADTVVITSNLNRKDSTFMRGVILKSIEGKPMSLIVDSFFNHLPADGYNLTHKYQSLSNSGVFRNMYGAFFGLKTRFKIEFVDSTGQTKNAFVNLYNPAPDTPGRRPVTALPKIPRKQRKKMILEGARSLRIDTALQTAFIEVNTFTKHNKLRGFFKRSFRKIKQADIKNLVVDMRANGGGSVTLSNLLTKYIAAHPFKIADSLYAVKNKSSYGRLMEKYFWNRLFFIFLTRKKEDGNYHFGLFERKFFKPKNKNHYSGHTYILTGGNTFSAATLFTKSLKDQSNVTVVGEETGGGAYGNTAWLIPDVTLPNTKIRLRMPLFRLVIDKDEIKGRGVIPEVEAIPTVIDIKRGTDFKMQKTIELIKRNSIAPNIAQ